MAEVVLDSSAILAAIRDEVGGRRVRDLLPGAVISAVNYAEVISKLVDFGASAAEAEDALGGFVSEIASVDQNTASRIGSLREPTRRWGLSLGDRACLALAEQLDLPVVTADRAWASLDLGVEVVLIR